MKIRRIISALLASAIGITTFTVASSAESKKLTKTEIFSGSSVIETAWTLGPSVQTSNGSFDPTEVIKDGYFTVEYTGTEGAV